VSPVEIVRRLKISQLFAGLPDDLLSSIAAETMPRTYAEGEYLWRAGDEPTHFTLIQTGLVEVRRATPSGESTMMGLFGPRESVGDFAVLDRAKYPADALAISESVEVLRVRALPVIAALREQPRVAAAVNQSLVGHMKVLRAKIDVMSAGTVDKRLAVLMQHLLERFGDEGLDGKIHAAVSLSRVQLARLVGARVETVIRTMSRWQKEGWLETTPEGFHLTSAEPLARIIHQD
jgi:CRP-like cAMP-binding protein